MNNGLKTEFIRNANKRLVVFKAYALINIRNEKKINLHADFVIF